MEFHDDVRNAVMSTYFQHVKVPAKEPLQDLLLDSKYDSHYYSYIIIKVRRSSMLLSSEMSERLNRPTRSQYVYSLAAGGCCS